MIDKESNKLINSEEFESNRMILNSFPLNIFIELTRNCNCYCRMCFRKNNVYRNELDMSFELFRKAADLFFPYAQYVDLRGFGESTILKNWTEIVDYALQYDCKFGIFTNLSVVDDRMWEKLIRSDFWLVVSFDGATKRTYEFIRRGAKFDNVVRNLRHLVLCLKNHKKPVSNLSLAVTVQRRNILELPDIMRITGEIGIRSIRLNPVRTRPWDKNNLIFHKDLVFKQVTQALKIAKKFNMEVSFQSSLGIFTIEESLGFEVQKRCRRPWSNLFIYYNGDIGPCDCLIFEPFVFGSLNKDSFPEIWNNDSYQLFRKNVHGANRLDNCKWCFENRYH
ncbi:MAG: radical SAM protein [Candidatus Omnitrophota bacterium]